MDSGSGAAVVFEGGGENSLHIRRHYTKMYGVFGSKRAAPVAPVGAPSSPGRPVEVQTTQEGTPQNAWFSGPAQHLDFQGIPDGINDFGLMALQIWNSKNNQKRETQHDAH